MLFWKWFGELGCNLRGLFNAVQTDLYTARQKTEMIYPSFAFCIFLCYFSFQVKKHNLSSNTCYQVSNVSKNTKSFLLANHLQNGLVLYSELIWESITYSSSVPEFELYLNWGIQEREGHDLWPSMVSHIQNLCSAINPSKCTHSSE